MADAAGAAMTAGLRRLTLVLERLQALTLPSMAAGLAAQRSELAAQFVATAAGEARDQRELDSHLARLRKLGIATYSGHVFRALAGTLAGWGALGAPASSAELEAMRQLVCLSGDPVEAGARLRELVHAAIEQFNDGHLGRAGVMFDLAEKLIAELPIAPAIVESLRERSSDQLAPERLARYAERQDCRPSLRRVFDFFVPLRPPALLQALDGERSRDRRRLLLALLEAHGAPARAAARERLRAYVEGSLELDPYSPRNLVYLLQAVPRPDDVPVEEEVQLVTRAPGRLSPVPLVKQVIAYLSATRHERAERALVTFLHVFETMLLQPEKASYRPTDVAALLDRTCVALARYGTARSWKALVDHGLQAELRMGATLARLAEAGRSQDLSASPEIVGRLLTALAAELPKKLLGFNVRRNDERVAFLIQALSGTPSPAVLEAFQAVVDRYPGQKFAEEAQRAMATLNAPARGSEPPAGLAGDLELFGLPDVLQALAGARQTGVLSLMNAQGAVAATVVLEAGRFCGGQYGAIEGQDAVYQLFERPFPGTFAFVSRRELPAHAALVPPCELVPLMLEGVRRHDELRRALALVPDGAALEPTGAPWSPLPDEDAGFAEQLWRIVAAGSSSDRCEAAWATDSYRLRRLLAHWAEEGALRIAAAGAAQAPAAVAPAATEGAAEQSAAAAASAEPAA